MIHSELYTVTEDGQPQTEFSLRVERLVKCGMPEWEAMSEVASGAGGRELLTLDDAWRWAVQTGRASYLPSGLRERFADVSAVRDYTESRDFERKVEARRAHLRREGQHDYDALCTAMSEVFAEHTDALDEWNALVTELLEARMAANPALTYRVARKDAYTEARKRRPDLWRKVEGYKLEAKERQLKGR